MQLPEKNADKQRLRTTIFIPLSGRVEAWEQLSAFLDQQPYCRDGRLVLLDTSQSAEFAQSVRAWLARCSYPSVSYLERAIGRPGLADIRRVNEDRTSSRELFREIHRAMCEIYSVCRSVAATPLTWVIEDDVIPPLDAYPRLLDGFCPDTVSVSGAYAHRYQQGKIVAWGHDDQLLSSGSGVQTVKGNGFGCVVLRSSYLRQQVFVPDPQWPDFDRAFYHRMREGELCKLNWDVSCRHLSPSYEITPCPHAYESFISESNFCEEFYLNRYPDVREAVLAGRIQSGYLHYMLVGKSEGRAAKPLDEFDEEYYLALYPDIAEAVQRGALKSGLQHYLASGRKEGRYSRPKGLSLNGTPTGLTNGASNGVPTAVPNSAPTEKFRAADMLADLLGAGSHQQLRGPR